MTEYKRCFRCAEMTMQDGFCTKHGCYVGMEEDIDADNAFKFVSVTFILSLLCLSFMFGMNRAEAQGCVMAICEDYPAPIAPYTDCPTFDGFNVNGTWDAWKAGYNNIFDSYKQSYRFYTVNGVWVAEQRHKTRATLIYFGWWWDEAESLPGVDVGHASCGIYLVPKLIETT